MLCPDCERGLGLEDVWMDGEYIGVTPCFTCHGVGYFCPTCGKRGGECNCDPLPPNYVNKTTHSP